MTQFNKWYSEYCHICSSINHIFIDDPFVFVYECWNCKNRMWIDEDAKQSYIVMSGLPASQVEEELFSSSCTIPCSQGYFERG